MKKDLTNRDRACLSGRDPSPPSTEHSSVPYIGNLDTVLRELGVSNCLNESDSPDVDEQLIAQLLLGAANEFETEVVRNNLRRFPRWRSYLESLLVEEARSTEYCKETGEDINHHIAEMRHQTMRALSGIEPSLFDSFVDEDQARDCPGGPPVDLLLLLRAWGERPCELTNREVLFAANCVNTFKAWRDQFRQFVEAEERAIIEHRIPPEDHEEYRLNCRSSWIAEALCRSLD